MQNNSRNDGSVSDPAGTGDDPDLPASGPLSLLLPGRPENLQAVRSILAGGNILIGEIVEQVLLDPAFALELFYHANRSSDRAPSPNILHPKSLVFRLGAQGIWSALDSLEARVEACPEHLLREFALIANHGNRIARVAEIIAFATFREHADDARTIGMFSVVGQMLACARFREDYIELARELNRPSLVYRLSQDHRFDLKAVQLAYLRSRNVPQALLYVFDRDFVCKTPSQAALRFIVDSACELVENHEHDRFDRYAPAKSLPGKSALRLLRLSERQHERIYEEVGAFLNGPHSVKNSLRSVPAAPVATVGEQPIAETLPDDLGEIEYTEVGEGPIREEGAIPFSAGAKLFVAELEDLVRSSRKTEELLSKLLGLLVGDGPYKRAALLVLQNSRKLAVIHTVAGNLNAQGKSVSVTDPISPLALGTVKIRSFNSTEVVDIHAPFGVSAYALAPIRLKNVPPVVLYVDCGDERCLPFEGRKLFRLVVGLLNRVLGGGAQALEERSDVIT